MTAMRATMNIMKSVPFNNPITTLKACGMTTTTPRIIKPHAPPNADPNDKPTIAPVKICFPAAANRNIPSNPKIIAETLGNLKLS